jgi:small-conductance mechanosensitive channel
MPNITLNYVDTLLKLVYSLAVLALIWIAYRIVRGVLQARIKDQTHMHTLRMLVRNAFFLAGALIVLVIWLDVGGHFTIAMGVFGAGIAFASQEVIGSFAGYLNIVTGSLYRIGDRVRLGNVVGDVMDIGILRTTVMEIGEWVQADQYTGRIVTIANRAVFSDPVYNYTQHWHYLWDEIMVPITYTSNWRRAAEIMLEHGHTYSTHLQAEAQAELREMVDRYLVHDTPVEPTLYIVMTDNWIEMTLRYVVEARERRKVKGELHRELLQHFESEAEITVASATFEIVGFPPLKGSTNQTDQGEVNEDAQTDQEQVYQDQPSARNTRSRGRAEDVSDQSHSDRV